MNPKVDAFFAKISKWEEELSLLRHIALGCGLTEELKWGKPCYAVEGRNVVFLCGFKEYCVMAFFKGALLADQQALLVQAGEHTQAMRQLRFTGAEQIKANEAIIKAYVQEAIKAEKEGREVVLKKPEETELPSELVEILSADPALKAAFEALTPGRRRGYCLHVAGAKQVQTRYARIDKCRSRILEGKGLDDR